MPAVAPAGEKINIEIRNSPQMAMSYRVSIKPPVVFQRVSMDPKKCESVSKIVNESSRVVESFKQGQTRFTCS